MRHCVTGGLLNEPPLKVENRSIQKVSTLECLIIVTILIRVMIAYFALITKSDDGNKSDNGIFLKYHLA